MKRLIIVGGGAGGIILANSLDAKEFDITIIDKSNMNVFQPAFLYIAFKGKKANITKPTSKLLKKNIKLIIDEVKTIDLDNRTIKTTNNSYLYDYLVIATGTITDTNSIKGLTEVNQQFGDYHTNIDNAQKVWNNLNNFKGGNLVIGMTSPICKCPPSPLEGVLLAEEMIRKKGIKDKTTISFFTPYPRPYPAESMNKIIEPILKERNINIYNFFDVDFIDTKNKVIKSIEGDSINYDLPILIPPCKGANIDYNPSTILDSDRFIKADKYNLKIIGYDDAFSIGDATAIPTAKSGVTAHLEAKVLAKILKGEDTKFDGRTNCPFDTGYNHGTFVIGSYNEPVVKYPPSRLKHFMKMRMEDIYWISLKGKFDWMFDIYFKLTDPSKLNKKYK
ncbi:MAG: NAD(P)/FAD-dependent oxidoreductase [Candidatus Micrarchaeia archaeon]